MAGWAGGCGHIGQEAVRAHLPSQKGALALLCGPPGLQDAARQLLAEEGWEVGQVLTF